MTECFKNKFIHISPKTYLLRWTSHEKLFQDRKIENVSLQKSSVSFTAALLLKLQRSVFGTYLKCFNQNQEQNDFVNENKLCLTDSILKNFDNNEIEMFEYNNNFINKALDYLKNALLEETEIDLCYLYENCKYIRLDDYDINLIDNGTQKFKNLQSLILCGNRITELSGNILPRNLKFLELYANEITSLEKIVINPPKYLQHIGLGRNNLTNGMSSNEDAEH